MKYKALAILLCLATVLTMALPGTLAVAVYEDGSGSLMTTDTCTCGTEDETHAEDCTLYAISTDEPDEEPICTCNTEDGIHTEDCPLYGANDDRGTEKAPSLEGADIYNRLMACTSSAQMNDVINALSAEQVALLTDGQKSAISAHYTELYEGENTVEVDPPAVNFTAVAPFMVRDYGMPMTLALFDEVSSGSTTSRVDSNGVETKKTAVKNADGTYTITLESFVTGNVTAGQAKPCDIVLVLDMSTTMKESFGSSGYSKIYELDQIEAYYIAEQQSYGSGTRYKKVVYCSDCEAWTNGCSTYWWDSSHTPGTKYTPKTSESGSGTQFYRYHGATSRMDALKQAACSFVDTVAAKDEDNKIAAVGFHDYGVYLTGTGAGSALLDAKTQKNTIKNAINGIQNNQLQAATDHDDGLKLAKEIFDATPNPDGQRNRVVVMITDGEPEPMNKSSWSATTVKEAITHSYGLKNTYGATVYTISVMPGSNAANPTSDLDKYMSYLSSNYPDAKYTGNTSSTNSNYIINQITPEKAANTGGTSYYLSANDISALESIFGQIAAQTGGASISLDATTVVQDAISDYFTLPGNVTSSDIHIYTADATGGKDSSGNYLFGDRTKSSLTPTISGNHVTVTGFDFSRNFVAETGRVEGDVSTSGNFHGRKLIIEFNVVPKSEFWGGNAVPTNDAANSGIYKGENLIENFEEPKVNVPIKQVTLTANDVNIYLMGTSPDASDLYTTNYPAEVDWRTAFVKVTSPVPGTISNTADGQYPITITVEPKYDPIQPTDTQGSAAEATTAAATANVYVYTPELTFCDSEVYYGDNAPTGYTGNLIETQWKHGQTLDTAVSMIGSAPSLTQVYTTESGKIVDGKIATKQHIGVDVAVKIGTTDVTNKSAFNHKDCQGKTCAIPEGKEFLLHVKTCSLTVTKTGTNVENDPFVFNIKKDGELYTQVTITGKNTVTISELPVGTYTVEEDTDWSWRYTSSFDKSSVVLSATNNADTITCTNTKENHNWLNHFTSVINTYGDKKQS